MPRSFKPFQPRRPGAPFHGKPREHRPPTGRYDAAGDPALEVPALALGTPFRFDAGLAKRLLRREVNPKEAFTARDAAGVFFRASVKELDANGGEAVPYERMPVSPEPVVAITLACAVLARQRMIFVAQKATELGVSRLVPLLTEHSVPGPGAREGARLARPDRPRGQAVPPQAPAGAPAAGDARRVPRLAAVGRGGAEPVPRQRRRLGAGSGPRGASAADTAPRRAEGGFSDAERKKLEGRALPWVLGGRVLRAETAPECWRGWRPCT